MGIVNLFLGGSGKYVAEVLKGTAAYYGQQMPPLIAFDLNTAATHTGTFTLGAELATVDPSFPAYAKGTVARRWSELDAGPGLTPLPHRGGPRVRPEVSVMRRIGFDALNLPDPGAGLWGVRAPGLLAFDAFFDPDAEGGAPGLAATFRNRVTTALQAAGANGAEVRVNIVASTAGGTGAGTFLPMALWLRQEGEQLGLNIKLSLVCCFPGVPFRTSRSQTPMQNGR